MSMWAHGSSTLALFHYFLSDVVWMISKLTLDRDYLMALRHEMSPHPRRQDQIEELPAYQIYYNLERLALDKA